MKTVQGTYLQVVDIVPTLVCHGEEKQTIDSWVQEVHGLVPGGRNVVICHNIHHNSLLSYLQLALPAGRQEGHKQPLYNAIRIASMVKWKLKLIQKTVFLSFPSVHDVVKCLHNSYSRYLKSLLWVVYMVSLVSYLVSTEKQYQIKMQDGVQFAVYNSLFAQLKITEYYFVD